MGGCDNSAHYTVDGHDFCLPQKGTNIHDLFDPRNLWISAVTRGIEKVDGFNFHTHVPLDASSWAVAAKDINGNMGDRYPLSVTVEGANRANGLLKPELGWFGDILLSPDTEHKRLSELINGRSYFVSHNAQKDAFLYLGRKPINRIPKSAAA